MPTSHSATLVSGFRASQILWVVLAALSFGAITVAGFVVSQHLTVPSSVDYPGTLTPGKSITVVELPANVPLETVLVKPGEEVKSGQTVALLDTDLMAARLRQLQRETRVAGVLRECLMNAHFITGPITEPSAQAPEPLAPQEDPETTVQIEASLEACRVQLGAATREIGRLEGAAALLRERVKLLNKKLSMIMAPPGPGDPKPKRPARVLQAHAGLDVMIERNALKQRIQTLYAERDAATTKADKERLETISKLSKDISDNLVKQEIFAAYLANPRLKAPEDGKISRVRPILAGTFHQSAESLLELRGAEAELYSAEVELSEDQSATLLPGTAVSLRLLGFTRNGPQLTGEVSRLVRSERTVDDDVVMALITLSDESQLLLSNPDTGIALRGQSTASAIQVTQPPQSLWKKLHTAVRRFDLERQASLPQMAIFNPSAPSEN